MLRNKTWDVLAYIYYLPPGFISLRKYKNPSLNCLHRRRSLAILGHAGPTWRIRLSLHLVLGLPCRLIHSRGVHSVTLFVHLLTLNPAHPCIPFLITSMLSFHDVGHLAECCPSQCSNAPLDLRKEIPSLCHRLTKVHASVYLFNGIPI